MKIILLAVVGTIALGANAQPVVKAAATATNKHELRKGQSPATQTAPAYTVKAAPGFTPRPARQQAPRTESIGAAPNTPVGTVPTPPAHPYSGGLDSAPNAPAGTTGTVGNHATGGRRYKVILPAVAVDTTPWPPLQTPTQWTRVQVFPGQVIETREVKGGRGQFITVRQGKGGGKNLSGSFSWGGKKK
ncbi:MAG: hypothetical protein HYW65_00045 [Candidatus Liptonbacteria bacterium]|nr:hypothetical protein [Candidatus Liptonbacteria bacterium]